MSKKAKAMTKVPKVDGRPVKVSVIYSDILTLATLIRPEALSLAVEVAVDLHIAAESSHSPLGKVLAKKS